MPRCNPYRHFLGFLIVFPRWPAASVKSSVPCRGEAELIEEPAEAMFPEVFAQGPIAIALSDPPPLGFVSQVETRLGYAILKRLEGHKLLTGFVVILKVRAILAEHQSSR